MKMLVMVQFKRWYHHIYFRSRRRTRYPKRFCQLFCMGVKRDMLLWKKKIHYNCLKTECSGKC